MIKDCHVGVKGIVCNKDRCLVMRSSSTDAYWDVPGGRIDNDESLLETLTRELREELPSIGAFKIKEVLGAYRLHKNIVDNKGLVLIFHRIEAEHFDVRLSDEHSEFKWVDKNTVRQLLEPGNKISQDLYNILQKALT